MKKDDSLPFLKGSINGGDIQCEEVMISSKLTLVNNRCLEA